MDESAAPRLRIRGLHAGYGRVQVLFGLDLDVAPGEAVAVLGTNGAGKTTLLRAVSGLLTPTGGTIALDGEDLGSVSAEARARRGVVQVRGADVFAGLTVDENLRAALVAHPEARRDAAARIERVYDVFPALATHRKQDAASLSGGEQQMVALGRALMGRPDVLVIDEMSLGLAPKVVTDLADHLRARNVADGLAVLLIEQNARLALDLCARAYVLEAGRVTVEGRSADLAGDPAVAAAYLGLEA